MHVEVPGLASRLSTPIQIQTDGQFGTTWDCIHLLTCHVDMNCTQLAGRCLNFSQHATSLRSCNEFCCGAGIAGDMCFAWILIHLWVSSERLKKFGYQAHLTKKQWVHRYSCFSIKLLIFFFSERWKYALFRNFKNSKHCITVVHFQNCLLCCLSYCWNSMIVHWKPVFVSFECISLFCSEN